MPRLQAVCLAQASSVKMVLPYPSRQQVTHTVGWLTCKAMSRFIFMEKGFVNQPSSRKAKSVFSGGLFVCRHPSSSRAFHLVVFSSSVCVVGQ